MISLIIVELIYVCLCATVFGSFYLVEYTVIGMPVYLCGIAHIGSGIAFGRSIIMFNWAWKDFLATRRGSSLMEECIKKDFNDFFGKKAD